MPSSKGNTRECGQWTFRSEYGREMEQVFRDQRREAAQCGARLWAETVWDIVQSAPAVRMEATRAGWYEDIHAREGTMKTMASLAMLIGAVLVASAFSEGWAGGLVNHDGRSLMAGILGAVAGALLLAAGIGLLRGARRAAARAQGAAVTCLAVFVLITLAAPRMSVFTTLLGLGFPVALLLYLRRSRGQGPSAPTMVALVLALSYTSDASGRAEVYLDSYAHPGRGRLTISLGGGMHPVWRGDGRELYYWRNGALVAVRMAAPVDGAAPVPGAQTVLFRAAYQGGINTMYDMSPDGQRFVIVQQP